MLKVTVAAGHALSTPGKQSPDGYKEWQYTDKIVRYFMEELSHYEGVAQLRVDDPTGKVDHSLQKRTNEINSWGANVHIDFHLNAMGSQWGTARGTETYVYTSRPKEATELAKKVQTNVVRALGFYDRGVKTANFHMLRETKMTAILVEFAFMDNKDEAMKMRTTQYQKKAALAVVAAVVAQYGLKKKPTPAPKPAAKSNVFFRVVTGSFSDRENAEKQVDVLKRAGFESFIDVYEK